MKRSVLVSAVVAFALAIAGPAVAHHPDDPNHGWTDYDPVDGPPGEHQGQHGETTGHLPASSHNVDLVGKVQLTNVSGGIADVAAFGNHAYLNAFSPECAGRAGAQGTGVHVVDISDPANPTKVGFLPAEANSYVGEGVSLVAANTPFFRGTLLIHNNETCNSSQPVVSGASLWDVTDPANAVKLGQFGDTTPAVANQTYHTTHSAQLFVMNGTPYAVLQDNQDLKDVDLFDLTNPAAPVMVWEGGLEDWPQAHAPLANGDTVFHHDMQYKEIGGHHYLALSYWDAGQILLNIDVPAAPTYVADSDFPSPDTLTGFEIGEGNSHQSYWSSNGKFLISTDEDFSPTRTSCRIVTGASAGATPCGEFGFTPDLADAYPDGYTGTTVWGGSGCVEDANGNGTSDRDELAPASETGATIAVFSRGVCFFSDKIRTAELGGYDIAVVGQSHAGTRNGLLPDGFLCGGQGSAIAGTAPSICIGHRAMHQLFADEAAYSGAEFADLPAVNTLGADLFAKGGVFDGWGYVRLHDGLTMQELDAYAVPEALDPAYAEGFGNLTVHEVKTDPRMNVNLAYFSYYDAGLRVAKFGRNGINEVGHYIAEGGNDFWGVFPHVVKSGKAKQGAPYLLMSDRDSGLWIFRYTGE